MIVLRAAPHFSVTNSMIKINRWIPALTGLLLTAAVFQGCGRPEKTKPLTVSAVMDDLVTRLYSSFSAGEMDTLSQEYLLTLFTPEERQVLSTQYWTFEVNVPVTVSLMRHEKQETVPFWLEASGFRKTEMIVKNESYTYEVWQKDFPKGRVELGVNGLDKHRPVYFISVAPQATGDSLEIAPVFPENQHFETMGPGAFTYHDWDELRLTEVPEALTGQVLFTTIRGRAREAHLIGAFRDTPYPSGNLPDQVLLTWSDDPKTTMDVQWRSNDRVAAGEVQYWQADSDDTLSVSAFLYKMEDRLLRNDRYIHRFTGHMTQLEPGMLYGYRVGSVSDGWSAPATFRTEAAAPAGFSFIWFGDTHRSPVYGEMVRKTFERHPEVSFYQIAGDLVSTGLYRDEWDRLFEYSGQVYAHKPLMPIPGNHDNQDGLGAWMYREMFSLPANGPDGIPEELTYAYTYQNALFLMIDGTQPVAEQSAWIEKQLAGSAARWKFAMFHFPPYNFEEDYSEIRKEWCSLFDKYHVDMVMSGHMHYYLRTRPMHTEKPVSSPADGTIYTMSISIEGKQEHWPDEAYAVIRYKGGPLYQHISIQDHTMTYYCYNADGQVMDHITISK